MKKSKKMKMVLWAVFLILVLLAGFTFIKSYRERVAVDVAEEAVETGIITYNGKQYKRDVDVRTVLFLGVDKDVQVEAEGYPGEAGQTDSLNLLIYNKKTKKAEILQISRDTMVNVEVLGQDFEKILTTEAQIAVQYGFGDGKKRSCRLTVDRVSELLEGVKVNRYLSLTMDGMVAAADAIGGVPITVPEDYTWIRPEFEKGARVVLDGKLTEAYVRSRDMSQLDSNDQRMERQSQYMTALIERLQNLEFSINDYLEMYEKMEPYMVTNMTVEEMAGLQEYEYSEEIKKLTGTLSLKNSHAEFRVDKEKMEQMILQLFYKEK